MPTIPQLPELLSPVGSDLLVVVSNPGGLPITKKATVNNVLAIPHTHAPGDITGTAVIDSDPRLSDARTPTAHAHAAPTGTGFRHVASGAEDAASKLVDTADINNDQVTYAKIQNVSATDRILGRFTAGAGDIEEIACTSAGRAILDDATAADQRTTLGLGLGALQNQSGLNNFSTADQQIAAATSALLTGSVIAVPVGKLRIGTVLRWRLTLSKTAAGTAANTFFVRVGTNGTVADAARLTFTMPVGTAVVDTGVIEIMATVRGPLSASGILQGNLRMTHNLQITGLATVPCVALNAISAGFDVTTANLFVSLSCTTAASTVLTFQQVVAEAMNL